MSYGQRKCANGELFSYFHAEASIHRPSFFCSLMIKDKTNISLTLNILHLRQGSFTRKVRTIYTLKIIVRIFVKLFMILVLHLRPFFIVRIMWKGLKVIFTASPMQAIWLITPHRVLSKNSKVSKQIWLFVRFSKTNLIAHLATISSTQVNALGQRTSFFTWVFMREKKPVISNTGHFFCFNSIVSYTKHCIHFLICISKSC